jgi:hypothetical protein
MYKEIPETTDELTNGTANMTRPLLTEIAWVLTVTIEIMLQWHRVSGT